MKTAFWVSIFLGLLVLGTNQAQANDLYCGPYGTGSGYEYSQSYDPYYTLHLIHYQRYRQPYQAYQPCFCPRVVTIGPWPKQVKSWPQEIRR